MPRKIQLTLKNARRIQKQNQLRDERSKQTLVKRLAKEKEYEEKVLKCELENESVYDSIQRIKREEIDYEYASEVFKKLKINHPTLWGRSCRERRSIIPWEVIPRAQYDISMTCEVTDKEIGKHTAFLLSKKVDRDGEEWGTFIMGDKYIPSTKEVCWPEELDPVKSISVEFVLNTLREIQENKNNAEHLDNPGEYFRCPLKYVNIYPCIRFQFEKRLFVSILEQKTHVGEDAARKIAEEFYSYI